MNTEFAASVGPSDVHGAAVGGPETDGDQRSVPTPSVATVPALLVFLDDEGILHWKPDDVKGARWRSSRSDSIEQVCRQADEVMPDRYEIEYVEEKS